jgi:hypothetical protein
MILGAVLIEQEIALIEGVGSVDLVRRGDLTFKLQPS